MPSSYWGAPLLFAVALLGVGAPAQATKPTVSVSFAKATRIATVRVTFAGIAPAGATVSASMKMRGESHVINRLPLQKTGNPHVVQATMHFSMAGDWTIEVRYAKSGEVDIPLRV